MKILEKIDRSITTNLLHNLIIQIDILSFPYALLMLRALTIFYVTFSLKQHEENLVVEIYCGKLDTVLQLKRGVEFEAKKLSK